MRASLEILRCLPKFFQFALPLQIELLLLSLIPRIFEHILLFLEHIRRWEGCESALEYAYGRMQLFGLLVIVVALRAHSDGFALLKQDLEKKSHQVGVVQRIVINCQVKQVAFRILRILYRSVEVKFHLALLGFCMVPLHQHPKGQHEVSNEGCAFATWS